MLAVSDQFKAAVNAVTRNLDVLIRVKAASDADYSNARIYRSQDLLLSLKIVDGQTTGGFGLGGTICPSLTAELHKTAVVAIGDKVKVELIVYNGGGNLTMASEFTVDNIKRKSDGSLSVTALGDMITLAKNYISELNYPATQLDVLEEISEQTGFPLHPLITHTIIHNPSIAKAPTKGKTESGETLYYTRREMLGFAAAINGGAAYIDQYGRIDIARHNDTGETFTHEQVFNESITEPFTVEAVKWSSSGFSYSLGDDYNENTIEFYNPLDYSDKEAIADNLEDDLIGFSYDGLTVKKQGCGYYQVGDIVHYTDISGNSHKLLVLGIVYEFNDGYFTETLHSLTSTETQRSYTGTETVTSPNAPEPSGSGYVAKRLQTTDTAVAAETTDTGLVIIGNTYGTQKRIFEIQDKATGGVILKFDPYNDITPHRPNVWSSMDLELKEDSLYALVTRPTESNITQSSVGMGITANGFYVDGSWYHKDGTWANQMLTFTPLIGDYGFDLNFEAYGYGTMNTTLGIRPDGLYINGKKVLTEE